MLAWFCCAVSGLSQDDLPGRDHDQPAAASHDDIDLPEDPELMHRRQESFLGWMIRSMGFIGLLIPVAAFFSFVLTLVIVLRGNGPFAGAALVLIVPTPLLLGMFGTYQGLIMSLQVIATSTVSPKPSEIADGIATALFTPLLGLLLMTPGLFVAILGSFLRSLFANSQSAAVTEP